MRHKFHLSQLTFRVPKRGYLVAGLLLRLFLAPFLSHPFDMRIFMAVGAAVAGGITPYGQYTLQEIFASSPHPHLYGTFQGIGYPPLWGLISGGMYRVSSFLAPNNLYAYVFALKIPVILGELALAVVIYNILRAQRNERIAIATYLLFIFSPFVISVGTIWGMFDVIAVVFALLSAYVLMHDWKLSSIFLAVSITLKVFPVILAPLYSILLYKTKRTVKSASAFLLSTLGLSALLTFLPMIAFSWPLTNMYNALTYHVAATTSSYYGMASFPYGAASPFNVFALLSRLSGSDVQPPGIFAYLWIPACVAVYVLLLRARTTVTVKETNVSTEFALITQWSLLILLTLFSTRIWVSEQNLIFLFVFFSLSVFLQYSHDLDRVQFLWLLLFIFVLVHVPAISFFWLPLPWTLVTATAFADGPLGWTRLLMMVVLTFGWLFLCWHYVVDKLRWW